MGSEGSRADGDNRTRAIEQVAKLATSAADSTWTELVLAIGFLLVAHWVLGTKLKMEGFETWLGMVTVGLLSRLSVRRQRRESQASKAEIQELEERLQAMDAGMALFGVCQTIRDKCYSRVTDEALSSDFRKDLNGHRNWFEKNLLWSSEAVRRLAGEVVDEAEMIAPRGLRLKPHEAAEELAPLDAKIEAMRLYLRRDVGFEELTPAEGAQALSAFDEAAPTDQTPCAPDEQ